MVKIRKQHLKTFGYMPSDSEILTMYQNGNLHLTDMQEDELIKYFNL